MVFVEVFAFLGFFALILFACGEFFRRKELCIIASLFILILGLIILVDGIQFPTGTTTTILTSWI